MIRYPGSKAKLLEAIVRHFPHQIRLALWAERHRWAYREPFFGSGAIGLDVIRNLPAGCSAWINDRDYWLTCMWIAIRDTPNELCDLIEEYEPSVNDFFAWKEQDGTKGIDPTIAGFRKLALHQMSFSGLGVMAGGPLGGREQDNAKYPCDCRWNPEARMQEVWDVHRLFRNHKVEISGQDFSQVINADPDVFYYCDPPYVDKGPELYKHSFTEADHRRLAKRLKSCGGTWLVSYDDHPLVRELYAGYRIAPIDVKYTVAITSEQPRRKNQEVIITNCAA